MMNFIESELKSPETGNELLPEESCIINDDISKMGQTNENPSDLEVKESTLLASNLLFSKGHLQNNKLSEEEIKNDQEGFFNNLISQVEFSTKEKVNKEAEQDFIGGGAFLSDKESDILSREKDENDNTNNLNFISKENDSGNSKKDSFNNDKQDDFLDKQAGLAGFLSVDKSEANNDFGEGFLLEESQDVIDQKKDKIEIDDMKKFMLTDKVARNHKTSFKKKISHKEIMIKPPIIDKKDVTEKYFIYNLPVLF